MPWVVGSRDVCLNANGDREFDFNFFSSEPVACAADAARLNQPLSTSIANGSCSDQRCRRTFCQSLHQFVRNDQPIFLYREQQTATKTSDILRTLACGPTLHRPVG